MDSHDHLHLRDARQAEDSFSFCPYSPVEPFCESFNQTHTFCYSRDSWMELSQVHRFPHHHFGGVHDKSFIYLHRVILELSGQTGCTSCYIGAYFPPLTVEMIVFSQIYYSLHYSIERYLFPLLVTISMMLAEMHLQWSTTFGFWLSHYPWIFSRLLCWDRGSYPSGLFSWDSIRSFIWDDDRFLQ